MAAQEFFFAWVADGGTTFSAAHHVHDEAVIGFELAHQEREVPSLRIFVRNPKVGLLNPARKQWAWVSWRKPDLTVVPLFHGRLVAMPSDIVEELVTLEFLARPEDYEVQKSALADALKVAPFWDPLFIDTAQVEDPDVVLAARPQLWHVGRTDKLVTVSHILTGEDGTVVLSPAEVLAGLAGVSYGKPVGKVRVVSSVEWTQAAAGTVDMSAFLRAEFGGRVSSYTGQGLESDWPSYGASIGGGWSVDLSRANLLNTDIDDSDLLKVPLDPRNDTPDIDEQDWWTDSPEGFAYWYQIAYDEWLRKALLNPVREARFALWEFNPDFFVRYEALRSRKEVLSFEVSADVQLLVAAGVDDDKVLEIQANSTILGEVDAAGDLPIVNAKNRSYFDSERGQDSIAYLINLARSHILMAARAVQITVDIPWSIGIQLSCRHDVVLSLPELPGGVAGGKVVAYRLALNDGAMSASVTFAAVVGKGNVLPPPNAGVESYVDDDYVEDEYQVFYGQSLQPVAGEIEYMRPVYQPNDDGINFDALTPAGIIMDVSATALLTFTLAGVADQAVTIGGRAYTLKAALTGADQVKIGVDNFATARNLADALNRTEVLEGTSFGTGTLANGQVEAAASDGIVRVTARVGGVAGNAIAVATTVAGATWDHPTLTDGNDGLVVRNPPAVQEATLLAEPSPGSVKMAIDRLNEVATRVELALKPVTGGPFTTEIALVTSALMVPKTIDLSAAAL